MRPLLELCGDQFAGRLGCPPWIGPRRAVGHITRGEHVAGTRGLHTQHPPRGRNADDVAVDVDVDSPRSRRSRRSPAPRAARRRGVELAVRDDDGFVLGQLEDVDVGQQVGGKVAVLDQWAQPIGPDQALPVVGDAMAALRRAAPASPPGSRCAAAERGAPRWCPDRRPRPRPHPRRGRSRRPTCGGGRRRRSPAGTPRPVGRQDPDQVAEPFEQRIEQRMVLSAPMATIDGSARGLQRHAGERRAAAGTLGAPSMTSIARLPSTVTPWTSLRRRTDRSPGLRRRVLVAVGRNGIGDRCVSTIPRSAGQVVRRDHLDRRRPRRFGGQGAVLLQDQPHRQPRRRRADRCAGRPRSGRRGAAVGCRRRGRARRRPCTPVPIFSNAATVAVLPPPTE